MNQQTIITRVIELPHNPEIGYYLAPDVVDRRKNTLYYYDGESFSEVRGEKIKMTKQQIEKASEYYAHNYFEMHETNSYKELKRGFEAGVEWSVKNSGTSPIEDLVKALKEDEEYFKHWKTNLAMAFYDELAYSDEYLPDLDIRKYSNLAAERFLKQLINE